MHPHTFCLRILGLLLIAALAAPAGLTGCAAEDDSYDFSAPRHEQVDDSFADGVDREPAPKTLYALGRILVTQGKDQQAEFVFMRIIKEHPKYMPAYSELAELYLRTGRTGDAIETLELGLRVSPQDPVLLNNLGMCWLLKTEYKRALDSFKEAAAVVPSDARYRSNMATALGMQGEYDSALALYEQVVPPDEAHYNLAVVCEARGDTERAKVEFERAERLQRDLSYESTGDEDQAQ